MGQLKKLLAEVFRVREEVITNDLSIHNFEAWDSLKHMDLVVSIEQTFGITLTADEIVSMVNVNDIKRVLRSRQIEVDA